MSSKRGRAKRANNARHQEAIDKRKNVIPTGRELHRTPSSTAQRSPNDSSGTKPEVKEEPRDQEIFDKLLSKPPDSNLQQVKDERTFISSHDASGNIAPENFIQGMEGYQWTEVDLEFVYHSSHKKRVQQIQEEINAVQKSLKSTQQKRDMALASRDKIQGELSKMLSCERIQKLSLKILALKSPSASPVEGVDLKVLLASLKQVDVKRTIDLEKAQLCRLRADVAEGEKMREEEEQLTNDISSCNFRIEQIKERLHAQNVLESLPSQETSQSAKPDKKHVSSPNISSGKKTQGSSIAKVPEARNTSTTKPQRSTSAQKEPKNGSAASSQSKKAATAPKAPKPRKTLPDPKLRPPAAPNTKDQDAPTLRRSKRIAAKSKT